MQKSHLFLNFMEFLKTQDLNISKDFKIKINYDSNNMGGKPSKTSA